MTGSSAIPIVSQIKDVLRPHVAYARYLWLLRFQQRENRVYTYFNRFPHQYRALVEHVLPAMLEAEPGLAERTLEVVVLACCSGEEVYMLSYLLQKHFPGLRFRVRGFDIVEEVVEQAKLGVYSKDQIHAGGFVTDELVEALFDEAEGQFRVKHELVAPTTVAVGDMTDRAFVDSLGSVDLLFAQNVLFHLPRPVARDAFNNIVRALAPGAALFVNGMDTDMRIRLTQKHSLEPIEYLLEEIHEDARLDRGQNWSFGYWGREPFSTKPKHWMRKYGTIFRASA